MAVFLKAIEKDKIKEADSKTGPSLFYDLCNLERLKSV